MIACETDRGPSRSSPEEDSCPHAPWPSPTPGKIACSVAIAPTSSLIAGSELIWILAARRGPQRRENRMFSRASQ